MDIQVTIHSAEPRPTIADESMSASKQVERFKFEQFEPFEPLAGRGVTLAFEPPSVLTPTVCLSSQNFPPMRRYLYDE